MEDKVLDQIVENLLYILPIIHKKLLKPDPLDIQGEVHLSRLHIGIIGTVYHEKLPISAIAKKFLIAKPQMTLLINQLVDTGIVTRKPNLEDRRVVDLKLTEKGNATLKLYDSYLRNNIRKKLAHLSEQEIEGLSLSLIKLRELGTTWEKNE
jgi:DNA-binding MarR family transcriptional regulator